MKLIISLGTLIFITGLWHSQIINIKFCLTATIFISFLYFILKLRHDFGIFPLILITKIKKRRSQVLTDLNDIKKVLKFSDKGFIIEELFASPAWYPILSVESTNGQTWQTLRKNLLLFIEHIPSKEKLASIAREESKSLIERRIILDSKIISISTLKIFLKWLFSEDITQNSKHEDILSGNDHFKNNNNDCVNFLEKDPNQSSPTKDEFYFINQYLTEEFLNEMYDSSLEYRKEIAIKGKGCPRKKQQAVDSIVNILKHSKYSKLFEWERPECYSILMQPFIISPMINISDIAVSLQNYSTAYNEKDFKCFNSYLDFCLFNEHPFPILERYEASTNTQYFIDMKTLREHMSEKEGSVLNFGVGVRGCMGRVYAREFIISFFQDVLKEKELFFPRLNHLYSGRDNDNGSFAESMYQLKVLFKVLKDEIYRNYLD